MEPISETSYWHVRYEPGSWLGAEPRGSIGLIGAGLSLFVLICLTFFLVGFLQLMMALHLAWIIGGLCGCLTWVTLLRYKKRNVVHFDPVCFAEHRRRPWGWRRKDITLPDESVRILARAEPNLSGRMTYTVALVSGYSQRPLFKETNNTYCNKK